MNRNFTLWALPCLKRTVLALFLSSVTILVNAAARTASTDGNWNSTTTWGGQPVPGTGDDVTIPAGRTVTVTAAANAGSVTINGILNVSSTLTLASKGDLVVNSGAFLAFNNVGTLAQANNSGANAGSITVNNNAVVSTANTNGIGGSIAVTRSRIFDAGVSYVFNGPTVTPFISNISQVKDVTFNQNVSLNQNLLASGNLTINTGATLDVTTNNRSIAVAGSWTNNGTLVPHAGTVTFNGTNQNLKTSNTSNFYNIVFSGIGTKTLVEGGSGLRVGNNLSVSTSGTILDLGIYVADNTSGTPTGTLSVVDGATLKISGGHVLPQNYATYTFSPTSTVEYYGGGVRDVLARTYGNLKIIDATTLLAKGKLIIAGDLTIGTGATFNATNDGVNNKFIHEIKGNWINNGTFNASTTTVLFNGTAAQIVTGSSITAFENLSLNNAAGLTLAKTAVVDANGILTLTAGNITSSTSNLLVLNDNATVTGAGNGTHINGPVQKVGNDAFVFPVGKGNKYVPIAISAPATATDAFTAEYVPQSGAALGKIGTQARNNGLEAVSNCEYWNLDRTTGSSAVDVTLSWGPDNACSGPSYIKSAFSLVVAHFSGTPGAGGTWDSFSENTDNVLSGTATAGTVTWKNHNTFSPFTIGTTDAAQAPLPVTFISFEGRKAAAGTQLTWKVGAEKNVAGYEVERKVAGSAFAKIGYVPATGSSSYTFTDAAPQKGVVNYRLKNIDGDGRFAYSNVVSLKNASGILVFPTVTAGKTTILHDAATVGSLVTVSTADGKQVKVQRPAAGSMQTIVDLSGLRAGTYLLQFNSGNGHIETTKIVKQ